MNVTQVRVSFLREKQPAKFEKSVPAVEFSATVDDGEDHEAIARQLMIDATGIVYSGLGFSTPEKVAKALANGQVPAEVAVTVTASEATVEAPAEAEETPEVQPKKRRGRPPGSRNTLPKAGTEAAKKHAAEGQTATAQATAEDDGLPPADDPQPNISTGEERVDPTDDGLPSEDDIPGEEVPDRIEFTPRDLHTLIIQHVNKEITVPDAKGILAHFKVARAQDLTLEQALEGKAMLEKLIEARSK